MQICHQLLPKQLPSPKFGTLQVHCSFPGMIGVDLGQISHNAFYFWPQSTDVSVCTPVVCMNGSQNSSTISTVAKKKFVVQSLSGPGAFPVWSLHVLPGSVQTGDFKLTLDVSECVNGRLL